MTQGWALAEQGRAKRKLPRSARLWLLSGLPGCGFWVL